ncbi:MAG: alcohol dehydrogenase [Planctomycetaceae bacterium]|nr:alcohol dehydrogenase [Planctomycetaceae bacterium]
MDFLDLDCPTKILFSANAFEQLGEAISNWGCRRAMIVSDPGIVALGYPEKAMALLKAQGMDSILFTGVHENPSSDDVIRGVEAAKQWQPDLLIGLGGGSSMDCAKGMNFVYTNGGAIQDYWGIGKAEKPMLPMVAIPTTAGTGSETQSFALISDAETHVKMACGDQKATCRLAILDPVLTVTQPTRLTALTGIDAIAHAVETMVTTKRNEKSLHFSQRAWQLLAKNFPLVLENPEDLEARGGMQMGACLAGIAIENSMLGATHALANPLTAHYGIVHGQAIATMLPHVIRFNAKTMESDYTLLAELAAENSPIITEASSDQLATFISGLIQKAELVGDLQSQSVEQSLLPQLAEDANKQWTKQFNPRTVETEDLLSLYQQAF